MLPHFIKRHQKVFKYTTFFFISTGTGCLLFQVRKTQDILSNAFDTSRINYVEPIIDEASENKVPHVDLWVNSKQTNLSLFRQIWNEIKFTYARRLVNLTQSGNRYIRQKAIDGLSRVHVLDNWHCFLLANMIDATTAVGLARCQNTDQRLFVDPPQTYLMYKPQMLEDAMKELLVGLQEKSNHPCMGYFIAKVFVDEQEISHNLSDHDILSIELTRFLQSNQDIIPMCLQSLVHHVSIESYAKDLITLNGLPLLLEIHNRYRNNIDVNITLCKIISYLSFFPENLRELHKTGWIRVLSQWLKHDDIRLSVPAARALANLDMDNDNLYKRHLYLLHPLRRESDNTDADVIVVHGLLGGVFFTWRQRNKDSVLGINECVSTSPSTTNDNKILEYTDPNMKQYIEDYHENKDCTIENCHDYEVVWDDIPIKTNQDASGPYSFPGKYFVPDKFNSNYTFCWPKDWLSRDFRYIRILGINYATSISMWAPMCPTESLKKSLEDRSDELMSKLISAGVGNKPIIWITHSMGGLIVKNMLCKAYESKDYETNKLCHNTKGIVFYSTPHIGSSLANLNQATSLLIWPSVEVQELRENSPKLTAIHNNFLKIVRDHPMRIISFVETKSTVLTALKINFLLVTPESGNAGIGEYYEVPLDHIGICKPANRQSFLYQKVVHLIQNILYDETYYKYQ